MFKRVRPVIIVVENSNDHFKQQEIGKNIGKIIQCINERRLFGTGHDNLKVAIFQLESKTTNTKPELVSYRKIKYVMEEKVTNMNSPVDLNPLLEYLSNFDYLRNKMRYQQPIVLFAMQGNRGYSFDEDKFTEFKNSYIFTDGFRVASSDSYISDNDERMIGKLLNDVDDLFQISIPILSCPLTVLSYAFDYAEFTGYSKTDVIDTTYPMVAKVKGGKIIATKCKTIRCFFSWLKYIYKHSRY